MSAPRWIVAPYLLLIMAIYAVAGWSDAREEERLSMDGFVHEHAVTLSAADWTCR